MDIGSGFNYLYGHVRGKQYPISLLPEQITAFILENEIEPDITITNLLDVAEIKVSYGIINFCRDQKYLREQLIPVLSKAQMRLTEPIKFLPFNENEEYPFGEDDFISEISERVKDGFATIIGFAGDIEKVVDVAYFDSISGYNKIILKYPDNSTREYTVGSDGVINFIVFSSDCEEVYDFRKGYSRKV